MVKVSARAGDAQQHLIDLAVLHHAVDQLADRLRLVAGRLELRMDSEFACPDQQAGARR